MPFAIDLNPRQSARTLEQAVRHQTEVILEPRIWPDAEPLTCRLQHVAPPSGRKPLLRKTLILVFPARCEDAPEISEASSGPLGALADKLRHLVGSYCDLTIHLGDQLYLCNTDVIRVDRPTNPPWEIKLHLSHPEAIQVAQRRKYRRTQFANSAKVRLYWPSEESLPSEGVGWLCNVSPGGMACRVESKVSDNLLIGEHVRVEFTLTPTDTVPFILDAVVCNKTPAGTEGKLIVGVQFLSGPEHDASSQAVELLTRRLMGRHILTTRSPDEEGS